MSDFSRMTDVFAYNAWANGKVFDVFRPRPGLVQRSHPSTGPELSQAPRSDQPRRNAGAVERAVVRLPDHHPRGFLAGAEPLWPASDPGAICNLPAVACTRPTWTTSACCRKFANPKCR